ncbi:type II secretion system protein [Nitrosomonas sp. HPC101]|uniref:type II secretion system protein n=1 Tax=Nitrosomonas sp. HPC101 TaxID=1658667 RepID=UPI00136FEFB1|nr:type II secretion system protein [Nitrosomonas sp. HPC101]MXS84725.1 type II secretion system protein [Nitrosomonas sp. HPC101]
MVIKQFAKAQGYIYIWMLFAVMLAGVMLAASGLVWQTEAKRGKEQELLFVGDQFKRAIESYYNVSQTTGGGAGNYPESLAQLLKDERFPVVKRHLRKIYRDPMTNSRDWGLIRQEDGGIIGIYSLSTGVPIKRATFPADYAAFENAESYQDWKFTLAASGAGKKGTQRTDGQKSMPGGNGMMLESQDVSSDPLTQNQSSPDVSPFPPPQDSADQSID